MTRPSRRQLIIAGLGLGASATLAACSGGASATSRPAAGFALRGTSRSPSAGDRTAEA